jgi:hypothetical protein
LFDLKTPGATPAFFAFLGKVFAIGDANIRAIAHLK